MCPIEVSYLVSVANLFGQSSQWFLKSLMALCQDSMLMVLDAELFPLWFFGQLY